MCLLVCHPYRDISLTMEGLPNHTQVVLDMQLNSLLVVKKWLVVMTLMLESSVKHCSTSCNDSLRNKFRTFRRAKFISRLFWWCSFPLQFLQHYLSYILLVLWQWCLVFSKILQDQDLPNNNDFKWHLILDWIYIIFDNFTIKMSGRTKP